MAAVLRPTSLNFGSTFPLSLLFLASGAVHGYFDIAKSEISE
jgi:hypothetical protein